MIIYSTVFKRAASNYYSQPLQGRQLYLGAHSIHQLCKTMVYENTKWKSGVYPFHWLSFISVCDLTDIWNGIDMEGKAGVHRYYIVVNQYTRKINSDKFIKYATNFSPPPPLTVV
jgi:hypothetical protein